MFAYMPFLDLKYYQYKEKTLPRYVVSTNVVDVLANV